MYSVALPLMASDVLLPRGQFPAAARFSWLSTERNWTNRRRTSLVPTNQNNWNWNMDMGLVRFVVTDISAFSLSSNLNAYKNECNALSISEIALINRNHNGNYTHWMLLSMKCNHLNLSYRTAGRIFRLPHIWITSPILHSLNAYKMFVLIWSITEKIA